MHALYAEGVTRTASATPDRTAASWPASATLWVVALGVMAGFQFWRGAPADGVLFTTFSVLLVAERLTRGLRGRRGVGGRSGAAFGAAPLALAIGAALAIVALLVAPRNGVVSIVVVGAIGIVALVLAWAPTEPRHQRLETALNRSRRAWAGVGIALCAWEAVAYVLSVSVPRGWLGFPTVSLLLEPVIDFTPSRIVLMAVWLALGIWLVSGARPSPRSHGTAPLPLAPP